MKANDVARRFEPGDSVKWYAAQYGWRLARRNIFVEGDTDSRYLYLAATKYRAKTGLNLLNDELKVIPVGYGPSGGTDAIKANLIHLWKLIELDRDTSGKQLFRAVVLLDDDHEGRRTCSYLTDRYIKLQQNRDVFLLKRVLPRNSQDAKRLTELSKAANAPWSGLDCEMEDLLCAELLELFINENPGCLRSKRAEKNNAHHCEFTRTAKANLCRWVTEYATCEDLEGMIEVVKSLRYYLGLEPDGDS